MNREAGTSREPTGDVVRRLIADLAALAALYGLAIRDHLRGLGRDMAMSALLIGAAIVLGIFALGLAVATLVLVVAIWLPAWLAALVVLAIIVAAMAILVRIGLARARGRRATWAAKVAEEVQWLRSLFPRES